VGEELVIADGLPRDEELIPDSIDSTIPQPLVISPLYKEIYPSDAKQSYPPDNTSMPYFFGKIADAMFTATCYSRVTPSKGNRCIYLHHGEIIAVVGKAPIRVATDLATVHIAAHSAVIIRQSTNGVMELNNISGEAATLQLSHRHFKQLTLVAGEELVIADASVGNGELNRIDGVRRQPIPVGFPPDGLLVTKAKIDRRAIATRERLFVYSEENSKIGKRIKRLKRKILEETSAGSL
jgi:hypothetical protein